MTIHLKGIVNIGYSKGYAKMQNCGANVKRAFEKFDGDGSTKCLEENDTEKPTYINASSEKPQEPPPYYYLTSPCLPPIGIAVPTSLREPLPPFLGYPPYPAGPPLLEREYPKIFPGPTFACPRCNERFLFYEELGIIQCPFCYLPMSVGGEAHKRVVYNLKFAIYCILSSILYATIILAFSFPHSSAFLVTPLIITGIVSMIRSQIIRSSWPEAPRIDFT